MGIAVITGSILARLLGPEGRGELAAVQNWASFVGLIAAFGLPDAIVYFSGKFPGRSGTYLASAISLSILIAIPFAGLGYYFTPLLLSAQSAEIISLAQKYLVVLLFLQASVGMLLHPLRGMSDFVIWNILRFLFPIGWLVVVLYSVISGINTVSFYISGYLIVLALLGLPVVFVVIKRISKLSVDPKKWEPMLRFGIPSVSSSIPQVLNIRLDQLIMAAVLAPVFLGYYSVAVTWSRGLSPFLLGVATVTFPQIASIDSEADQIDSLARSIRSSTLLATILVVLLILITPFGLIMLFGEQFKASIPVAILLVIASGISGFSMILVGGLRGLGLPSKVIIGEVIGLVVTIIALIVLLPRYGIVGAAISSLFGYSLTAIVLIYQLHHVTKQSLTFLLFPKMEDFNLLKSYINSIYSSLKNNIRFISNQQNN
jgi:O-antigen/teichoic acid export membrane protein